MLLLLHVQPDTLRVVRYHQAHPQPDQQDVDIDSNTSIQWSAEAMYQTGGILFGQQHHASTCFGSEQLMASPDGTQVVLITDGPGMCL